MNFKRFTKGQSDAQDPLNENFDLLNSNLEKIIELNKNNTDWEKLVFTAGVTETTVDVRCNNGMIQFRGALTSPAEKYDVGQLPNGWKPSKEAVISVGKNDVSQSKAIFVFSTDGKIRINFNSNVAASINMAGVAVPL
ncbi:hypothetical protein [Carnobacterium maltaromaticum]|uniref:hypothetical protein n=1 Tax=Carnobacterium maltaromaticum TaxID=2751 RepID=UPI0039AF1A9A